MPQVTKSSLGEVLTLSAARELRTEIEALEAWYGPNAYSTYLRTYSRRPSRAEAAGIGRLLGGRVKADDGSMQPPLNESDRAALRGIKSRREAYARRYDHLMRLKTALFALAEIVIDPAELVGVESCVLSPTEIDQKLDAALCWLNRFAELWHGRTKETCAASSQSPGGYQKQDCP